MTITSAEIRECYRLYRSGLDKQAVANQLGKPRAWVQRRLKMAVPELPRVRVPSRPIDGFEQPPAPRPEPLYSVMPEPVPASSETTRIMAIGDLHDDPHLAKDRFRWLGRMAASLAPDRIVQIGDIADFESLSFHSANETESARYKPHFMSDLASLREALDLFSEPMAGMTGKPRIDVTLGNHENRIWRFEDQQPETSGMLQRDFTDILAAHGFAWHKYGAYLKVGGVQFTHCPFSVMGKPIGGVSCSATVARQTSADTVFGHTHKTSVLTVPKIGDEARRTVIDLGCALPWGHVQSYAKHTLTGWWQGAYMLTIRDGHIQGHEAIPMFEIARRFG